MTQLYNFITNWDIKNGLFFFNKEKKQKHCYVWFKIVFTFFFLFFFSSKNIKAQCTLSCNAETIITLDENGKHIVTPSIVLSNPACNPNDFSIQITDASGNVVDNPIDCAYLNQTLDANVISNIDGNSCWGTILVKDNLAPSIQCQNEFIFCFENAHPDEIGYPSISDNCTPSPTLTYVDDFTDLPCYTLQNGQEITAHTIRTWTATDNQGNATTCTQNIYFKRVMTADIVFPLNRDDFESLALDCQDGPSDLALAGEPTINGIPVSSDGLCELAVTYTDQTFEVCGTGGYKIIRTWTAVDWCSSEFILDAQVINVMDKTAPNIICPNDLTIGTNSNHCSGEVILPQAVTADDCSEITITANWEFGSGFGPFADVPVGTYIVTYLAEDACGNISNCNMTVTVEDNAAPVVFCESHTVVSLLNNGLSTVYASSIDDGSYDNCGIAETLISRDGQNFADSIVLDCTDATQNGIPVFLRVYDTNGNYNDCQSTIQLQESISPEIICPLSVTLHCADDVLDLNLTGEATAFDNCGIDSIYFSDVQNLNTCGEGTVTRTWIAEDVFGNSTSCIQIIQIEDNTPLTIQFPANIDLSGCASATTPDVTGEPIINNDCESLGITFDDVTFTNAPDLCIKILRTWTVVNWCQYEPNNSNSDGYETFTQVIKVIDDGSTDSVIVAGVITNEKGAVMSNVEVVANAETVVCMNGVYEFPPMGSSELITVTPQRDGDDNNGITTFDMVFIQRHILGILALDSPYKIIAADINRSGSVTTFDLVFLRRLILQQTTEFTMNTSWRFVDANFEFTDPMNPFLDDFPEFIVLNPAVGEENALDFVAIKIGDVNGSASND